jgi:hypothetical protein
LGNYKKSIGYAARGTCLFRRTIAQIEQWRIRRKRDGLKTVSINRRITALKAAIGVRIAFAVICVDLNTVREFMKVTLKYAHLASEMKMRAVETLDR